jgi:hypothetical protein
MSKTFTRTIVVGKGWVMILTESIVMLNFLRHSPLIGKRRARLMLA